MEISRGKPVTFMRCSQMPLQVMSAARLGEAGLHRLMSSVVTEMSCSTPSRSLNGVLHRLMRSVVTEIKLDPIGSDWTLLRCIG